MARNGTSLNGWPAYDSSSDRALRWITIPGVNRKVCVARKAAPVFAAFLYDWHRLMGYRLKLNVGPIDGWEWRAPRQASGLSNHSSGTAVDVRYDVLHADGARHMTDQELQTLDTILSWYVTADGHRILASGGWWNPGSIDEMHTELSQSWERGAKRDTTAADVRDVRRRMKIDYNGNRPL